MSEPAPTEPTPTETAPTEKAPTASAPEASSQWWRTEDGWLVFLGVVPLLPHAIFHLAEQWTALGGRAAWLGRMRVTSSGAMASLFELLVVLGYLAWAVLLVRAALAKRPSLSAAVDGESPLSRTLATLARPAAFLTAALGLVHVATLWLPRFVGSASLAQGYEILRSAAGRPPGLLLMAVGISAFVIHVAASVPSLALLLGYGGSRDNRQSSRLVGVGLAACLLVLFTQLAGWHATGTGTVWPIAVVEVDDAPLPPED